MNEKQKPLEESKNTIVAFSDWLDLNSDGYIMLITQGGTSMLVAKGEHDKLETALASGMLEEEKELNLVRNAMMIVAKKRIDELLKKLKTP